MIKIIETNLTFKSNYQIRTGDPKGPILHHAAKEICTVEDVHRWHQNAGYAGIGYHFFVRKNGTVYRGRPENWIGAHTSGYNDYIGICCEGNFETETMPAAQKNAVAELLRYLNAKYGNLPVSRHKDHNATACPGKNFPFDEIVKLSKESGSAQPTDSTLYRVQIGAFANKSNADTQLKKVKAAGFDSFIAQADGLYKVQTGAFSVKANAQAQLEKLKALGFDAFITSGAAGTTKSVGEIAKEVIAGKWGNGQDRINRLKAAGYDPDAVQKRVNEMLKG